MTTIKATNDSVVGYKLFVDYFINGIVHSS